MHYKYENGQVNALFYVQTLTQQQQQQNSFGKDAWCMSGSWQQTFANIGHKSEMIVFYSM